MSFYINLVIFKIKTYKNEFQTYKPTNLQTYKHVVFSIFYLAFFNISNAQVLELTRSADLIVEAAVVSQNSYWNADRTGIYTDNEIKVAALFKGDVQDSIITVVTIGGEVEDFIQFQMHSIQLASSKKGYFFLKEDKNGKFRFIANGYTEINNDLNAKVLTFDKVYLKHEFEEEIIEQTKFPKLSYHESMIWQSTKKNNNGDTCSVLPIAHYNRSIEFIFDNPHFTEDKQYLEFDILAKVNTPGLKFGKANLFVKYTKEFGSNVIEKETIEVEKGEILEKEIYNVKMGDATSQSFFIKVETANSNSGHYTFSAKAAHLLKVKIKRSILTDLGKISFDDLKIEGQVYYWCQGEFQKFNEIIVDNPINHLGPEPVDPIGETFDITYTLENQTYFSQTDLFWFDIYASSTNTSDYSEGTICINYNQLAFGPNVLTNGLATFYPDNFLDSYDVNEQDFASNTILLHISSIGGNYSALNNQPTYLGKLVFNNINCGYSKDISFNPMMLNEDHLHNDGVFNAYDDVNANDELTGLMCNCAPPIIFNFSPQEIAAGNGDILTINGANFGVFNGTSSKVEFNDGDFPKLTSGGVGNSMETHPTDFILGNNILGWTDSKIEVKVPSVGGGELLVQHPACSGKFKVFNACGSAESGSKLEIPYAVMNNRKSGVAHKIAIKEQDSGGICFTFSSQIPNWIKIEFENALASWCNQTSINFFINTITSNAISANATDDINLISSESVNGIAGVIFTGPSLKLCENGTEKGYYITDIDIKIDPQYTNIGMPSIDNQTKLRNALTHEIGHAHMINHALHLTQNGSAENSTNQSIVYYNFTNVSNNVSIKAEDRNGALEVFPNSQPILSVASCGSPISTGYCNVDCTDGINSILDHNLLNSHINTYVSNENVISLNIDKMSLTDVDIVITDCVGKIMHQYNFNVFNDEIELPVRLNAGIYLINLQTKSYSYGKKIILL